MSLIADDVLDGRLSSFSFHYELGLREMLRQFILRKDIHPDTFKMVEKFARQSVSWGSLLLLRALLAHNLLLFALTQRRWRVDYGLDPSSPPRTLLAIPYRAKDVPAEHAEFGHPDITILLTCLSYYHGGLSEEQLRNSFELLLKQDDPSSEYVLWLEDCDIALVPSSLQTLSGVNTKSLEQWVTHITPLFARNKQAIDVYLSKVVFAKHAKEFPQRISVSYWDIGERRNHPVTGEYALQISSLFVVFATEQNMYQDFQGPTTDSICYPLPLIRTTQIISVRREQMRGFFPIFSGRRTLPTG